MRPGKSSAVILLMLSMLLICILLTTGCKTTVAPRGAVPEGFALYDTREIVKAVSPDGVMFRIRAEKNEPEADLPFWSEALKIRMLNAGYRFLKESDVMAGNHRGYLLELAAPLGVKDYSYLIALFLNDRDQLLIVESVGEVTLFNTRREDIVAAIKQLEF